MIGIAEALMSLRPNAEWVLRDDALEWLDTEQTQPTQAEIDTEVTRLQDIYDSQAYARARKIKYDALNQDELRFDDLMNGTTTWQDAILAIKAEIPKPQENN